MNTESGCRREIQMKLKETLVDIYESENLQKVTASLEMAGSVCALVSIFAKSSSTKTAARVAGITVLSTAIAISSAAIAGAIIKYNDAKKH